MITKGVPSVPSPVCNLCKFDASVTHEVFTDAVVGEFRSEYGVSDEVSIIPPYYDYSCRRLQATRFELHIWE